VGLLLKIFSWFHAVIPVTVSNALGKFSGWLMFVFLPGKRRLSNEALRASFPDWTESKIRETTYKVFLNQGLLLSETFRRIGKPRHNPLDDIRYDPEQLAAFDAVMKSNKGALVLTAHINNYEYLSAWAARFFPMSIAAKPIKPKVLGDFVQKMRKDSGITELPHHGSYRALLRAAQAGNCIGFIMDQNMKKGQGVFVTFFGRPACTTAGLAMLSAHAQVPVVPVFLLREGRFMRIRILPAIPPPLDREKDTLHDATQKYSNAIEQVIREQPESWIWMHKRWKTAPLPGERITLPDGSVRYA
jgi:Kdo2-lipid IVA lauroyltransferase/acyltransferase